MEITLRRNVTRHDGSAPWTLRADLAEELVRRRNVVDIPVHETWGEGRAYNAEVCGWRVEAAGPSGLVEPVGRLLRGLTNAARLPTYVFVARRSRRHYPVYTVGDEVVAATPGGPVFRHVELAKVRDHLTEYLHAVGELGAPGKSDVLHVRGVSARTLALVRPLFYLKKRPSRREEHEFWAPVFPTADGDAIYTYAASGRREIERTGGAEVLQLRSQVAQALRAAGRRLDEEHGAGLRLAADHPFRLGDVAYERDGRQVPELLRLRAAAEALGVCMVWSSVHVHLTPRPPDKGQGLLRFAADHGLDPATILTIGDAPNDEGLFVAGRFGVTVGTADVPPQREAFGALPTYVTDGREAEGFLQVAQALLAR